MLRNYLVTALRRMRRHGAQTLVNLVGLSAGIACCLLIFLFVRHETSFDAFHEKADRIYRLNKVYTPEDGAAEHHAVSSGMMGPTLVQDYPEVRAAVRLLPWFDPVVLTRGEASVKVPTPVFADRSLFDVFDFRLLRGDPSTALEAPMSIVLTEDVAVALFSGEDPLGQTLVGPEAATYTVTGIAERAPATSHLTFDALISWSSTVPGVGQLGFLWMNNWMTQSLYTYVELTSAADEPALEARLSSFMERHFPERAAQYAPYLQPLEEVYLDSGHVLHARAVRSGSRTLAVVFSIVGVLVLFIAGVNFVNLSTARASRRMREVGVRKALGATRRRLAVQFVVEACLVSLAATAAAAVLLTAAIPSFQTLTGRVVEFDPLHPLWMGSLLAIALATGLAAGAYPALLQSGYSPIRALRLGASTSGSSSTPRRVLVVAQFTISIALLIGTAVVYRQMQFVQHKHLGLEADQVIALNAADTQIETQFDTFTERLRQHAAITSVSAGRNVPGHGTISFTVEAEGQSSDDLLTTAVMRIGDPEMKDVLGLEMVEGRFFSADRPSELRRGVVINQELARSLGWTDPIGKRLDIVGELTEGRVIGVARDYHFESLHRPIDPMAIIVDTTRAGWVLARVSGGSVASAIDAMRDEWQAFEARYPFEYSFLDDAFEASYESERRMMTVLGLFTLLAVGIGCLGLWGLAAFLAEERTKEIGIRKILGASSARIVAMMTKETAGLVVVSFVLAAPISYVLVSRWLDTFAYRIEPSAALYVGAGAIAALLALSTVSIQTLRTALTDPVKVLRSE